MLRSSGAGLPCTAQVVEKCLRQVRIRKLRHFSTNARQPWTGARLPYTTRQSHILLCVARLLSTEVRKLDVLKYWISTLYKATTSARATPWSWMPFPVYLWEFGKRIFLSTKLTIFENENKTISYSEASLTIPTFISTLSYFLPEEKYLSTEISTEGPTRKRGRVPAVARAHPCSRIRPNC